MTKLSPLITEFTNNPTGMSVLILGGLLQVLLVMMVIWLSFQGPEYHSSVRFFRAFIYSLIFVLGAPVLSLAVSALFVLGFPHIVKYLDVLTLVLGPFQSLEASVAATSRPWGYSLAILITIGFLAWMISYANRYGRFGWRHAGYVALALVGAIVFCQLTVYSLLVVMRPV